MTNSPPAFLTLSSSIEKCFELRGLGGVRGVKHGKSIRDPFSASVLILVLLACLEMDFFVFGFLSMSSALTSPLLADLDFFFDFFPGSPSLTLSLLPPRDLILPESFFKPLDALEDNERDLFFSFSESFLWRLEDESRVVGGVDKLIVLLAPLRRGGSGVDDLLEIEGGRNDCVLLILLWLPLRFFFCNATVICKFPKLIETFFLAAWRGSMSGREVVLPLAVSIDVTEEPYDPIVMSDPSESVRRLRPPWVSREFGER